jgi:pyridoxamine 5'-phosphate oxidase
MSDSQAPGGTGEPDEPRLREADVAAEPLTQFRAWLDAAQRGGVAHPHAVVVATADSSGRPSARTMILREVDELGFALFTDHHSRKGHELAANPRAALVFLWQAAHRQVTVSGTVATFDAREADRAFAARPRAYQLAAWAAPQSSVLPDRAALEARLSEVTRRYDGREVPRPPAWGGFRVVPDSVEFWQGHADRLHDRLRYRRRGEGWMVERLAP